MTPDAAVDGLLQPEQETTIHPDDLTPDGDVPNEPSDTVFDCLCESMRERGWTGSAIIADTDGRIVAGEHRWRAAQEAGLTTVPVRIYDFTDEERALWHRLAAINATH